MVKALLANASCWLEHIRLDPATWRDPPSIKLRAAQGLEAADYLLSDFFFFGVGAGHRQPGARQVRLQQAQHGPAAIAHRDHYYTRLRASVEALVAAHGGTRAPWCLAHSMGGAVLQYFLHWVESPLGGRSPGWVARLVHVGAPKAVAAWLSGEVRDTADLGCFFTYLVDRAQSIVVFRSFGRLGHVWLKAGARVWGAAAAAAAVDLRTAAPPAKASGASLASATPPTPATVDADGALELLAAEARPAFMALLRGEFACGVAPLPAAAAVQTLAACLRPEQLHQRQSRYGQLHCVVAADQHEQPGLERTR